MAKDIKRVITYFKKSSDDESLVGEIPLPENIDISRLQKIFRVDENNPLYECYPIGLEESEYFTDTFDISFDFDNFEYFAECYVDE